MKGVKHGGVDLLIAGPPPANSTAMHSILVHKNRTYVLTGTAYLTGPAKISTTTKKGPTHVKKFLYALQSIWPLLSFIFPCKRFNPFFKVISSSLDENIGLEQSCVFFDASFRIQNIPFLRNSYPDGDFYLVMALNIWFHGLILGINEFLGHWYFPSSPLCFRLWYSPLISSVRLLLSGGRQEIIMTFSD